VNELEQLAAKVIAAARAKSVLVATAESLTGGMLADSIVSIPGASEVFLGGVIAYRNEAKVHLLNVSAQDLSEFGAVSAETAIAMAKGARAPFVSPGGNQVVAVATTGVAGPTQQEGKAAGTVYIGCDSDAGYSATHHKFEGDRAAIRMQATAAAFEALLGALEALPA
jgi:PncC family amidohydrolase